MYNSLSTFTDGDFRNKMPIPRSRGCNECALLDALTKKCRCTKVQLSLAWIVNKYPHMIVLLGSRKLERIKENDESSFVKLSQNEIETIDHYLKDVDFDMFGGH